MGAYKRYKVIDNVQEPEFAQWVSGLVQKALRKCKVEADTLEIYAISEEHRNQPDIFIKAGDQRFILRIAVFMEIDADGNGDTCAEKIAYSVLAVAEVTAEGEHIYKDNPIAVDTAVIKWDNRLVDEMYEQQRQEVK